MTNYPYNRLPMHTARLISITPDAEKTMGYIARVSNPKNQDNPSVAKLLGYCIKHGHWSVFEHAFMTVEINTTRAISAQVVRHRSFTYSEFSQRYAEVTAPAEVFDLRSQDLKNRQSSIDNVSQEVTDYYQARVEEIYRQSNELYESMLHSGIAKECARNILPLATPTRLYMSGSIRSFLHYVDLRSANGTQKEHQQIALAVRDILIEQVPTVAEAMWGELSTPNNDLNQSGET